MPIGETLASFFKISKRKKPKRKTPQKIRPTSFVDVADVIRNIEGLDSSYHSFDIDFQYQCEIPSKLRETPKKSRKSENRRSWMSFMCGMDNFDYQNSNEELRRPEKATTKSNKTQNYYEHLRRPEKVPTQSNKTQNYDEDLRRPEKTPNKFNKIQIDDDDLIKPVKEQTKSNKSENRKSWMSLMCGSQNLDFGNQCDTLPKLEESPKKCQKTENRKSWMSLMCGTDNMENDFRKSVYRDSGISLLSDDFVVPKLQPREKYQSKSCNDLLETLRSCDDTFDTKADESLENDSMNNLFRTTSIQENSLRLMRKRHRNVKRKRANECDSCYSSCDFRILAGSKSENDLTSADSIVEREVRFAGIQENSKGKSVSSMDVGRFQSMQLKSWQIRRQRRDLKNKEKRESRNLELLLSKDFEFQERLIL